MGEQTRSRLGRRPREELYERLDIQIAELWQRMGGLPNPLEARDIWRGIWFQEARHSTAIEGNTLVARQVETLLAEGKAAVRGRLQATRGSDGQWRSSRNWVNDYLRNRWYRDRG